MYRGLVLLPLAVVAWVVAAVESSSTPSDLELVVDAPWHVGAEEVAVLDLVPVSGTQEFAGIQVHLTWDPGVLELQGAVEPNEPGDYDWFWAGFPDDGLGINDSWDDGDAFWVAYGVPGGPYPVAPLCATGFVFKPLAAARTATISTDSPYTKIAAVGGEELTGERGDITLTVLSGELPPD